MGKVIAGIDIGSWRSSICVYEENGVISAVPVSDEKSPCGACGAPTLLYVDESGRILAGQDAWEAGKQDPDGLYGSLKKNQGRMLPEKIRGREFRNQDLYAELFRYLKKKAEGFGGSPISSVRVSCPFYWTPLKRKYLAEAVKEAGFSEVVLVSEETAAALACLEGRELCEGDTYLLYDFGDSGFTAALLQVKGRILLPVGEPERLRHCKGRELGGQGFRQKELLSWMAGQTTEACERQMKQAGVRAGSLNGFLLAGGVCRLPEIRAAVEKMAGTVPVIGEGDLTLKAVRGTLLSIMGSNTAAASEIQQRGASEPGSTDMQAPVRGENMMSPESPFGEQKLKNTEDMEEKLLPENPHPEEQKKPDHETDSAAQAYALRARAGMSFLDRSHTSLCTTYAVSRDGRFLSYPWLDPGKTGKVSSFGEGDNDFLIVLFEDGTAVGIGNNHGGQCDVQEWKNVVTAACGYDFSVGLMKNGRVTVAGGSDKLREATASWTDMVQVVCGPGFAAGLRKDGTVAVAGLGEDEERDERMAREAAAWRDMTFLAAGLSHLAGLRADGTAAATGDNRLGQCSVSGWKNLISIDCGFFHTLGLRKDGTAAAAGSNSSSQCCVEDWQEIAAIACGPEASFGLRTDGTAVAEGENGCGECNVEEWENLAAIVPGAIYTMGIRKDGTAVRTNFIRKTVSHAFREDEIQNILQPDEELPWRLF